MILAIASDSHDNLDKFSKAVEIANETNCKIFLFAGDLISAICLKAIKNYKGKVHMIQGNNEAAKMVLTRMIDSLDNAKIHGVSYEGKIKGKSIFMSHFPQFSELAAKSNSYDICIHGHTHEVSPGNYRRYVTLESRSTYRE